jgi:hydroxyacylglutathione hydrolase
MVAILRHKRAPGHPVLRAIPLPAFQDNYIWLLAADDGAALVVDPGAAAPVLQAAADGLRPVAILLTHHHADHVGGAGEIASRFGIPCHGPHDERIAAVDRRVGDGDEVHVPALGLRLRVLDIPGHTRTHIACHADGHLFCGDTLFSLGCGRLFEGTPAQMLASLDRLAALPGDTAVYCGHEYTEANGRFARAVEPDNPRRDDWLAEVSARRARGEPSLPSTIAIERDGNPFLRIEQPALRRRVDAHAGRATTDRVDTFAELRRWKDDYR